MKRLIPVLAVLTPICAVGLAAQNPKRPAGAAAPATAATSPAKPATRGDWFTVGNDPGSMKFSPLTQITPQNVTQLTTAWTYDMGIPAAGYTVTPIVVQRRDGERRRERTTAMTASNTSALVTSSAPAFDVSERPIGAK